MAGQGAWRRGRSLVWVAGLGALAGCQALFGVDLPGQDEGVGGSGGAAGMGPMSGGGQKGIEGTGGGGSGELGSAGADGSGGVSGGNAGAGEGGAAASLLFSLLSFSSPLAADATYVYWAASSEEQTDTLLLYRASLAGDPPVSFFASTNATPTSGISASAAGVFFHPFDPTLGRSADKFIGMPPGGGAPVDVTYHLGECYSPNANDNRLYFGCEAGNYTDAEIWTKPFSGGTATLLVDPRQWARPSADVTTATIGQASNDALAWVFYDRLGSDIRQQIAVSKFSPSGVDLVDTQFVVADTPLPSFPYPVRVALRGGWVYWVRADVGPARSIMRTPEGGGAPLRLAGTLGEVIDLAVDDKHVYFIESLTAGAGGQGGVGPPSKTTALRRIALEAGSDVEDLVPESGAQLRSVALSADAVYWIEGVQVMGRRK